MSHAGHHATRVGFVSTTFGDSDDRVIAKYMNHKTLTDVKDIIEEKLKLMNELWDESCGAEWNEKYKTLEEFSTELQKVKL